MNPMSYAWLEHMDPDPSRESQIIRDFLRCLELYIEDHDRMYYTATHFLPRQSLMLCPRIP